jgi:hypothetical protein
VPQSLGLIVFGKPQINEPYSAFKIAVQLPPQNILRQSHIQRTEGIVDVHNKSLFTE